MCAVSSVQVAHTTALAPAMMVCTCAAGARQCARKAHACMPSKQTLRVVVSASMYPTGFGTILRQREHTV